jgi:hypothetical protein
MLYLTAGGFDMAAPAMNILSRSDAQGTQRVTLLELVKAVSEVTNDDAEIVATVSHMLRSGRVYLAGNFRDTSLDLILGPERGTRV